MRTTYIDPENVFSCSGCSASHWQNHKKTVSYVFERGKNLQQNGILHFVIRLNQLSEIGIKEAIFSKSLTEYDNKKVTEKTQIPAHTKVL